MLETLPWRKFPPSRGYELFMLPASGVAPRQSHCRIIVPVHAAALWAVVDPDRQRHWVAVTTLAALLAGGVEPVHLLQVTAIPLAFVSQQGQECAPAHIRNAAAELGIPHQVGYGQVLHHDR